MRQQEQQHDAAEPAQAEPELDAEADRGAATARGLGAVGKETGAPLPASVRSHFERRFNADFSDVRIRISPEADAMGALAYTQGTEIVFAPGAPAAESEAGRELIGHELAHVVQQRKGRVPAAAGAVNDDPALEAEADQQGNAAAGEVERAPEASAPETSTTAATEGPVQLKANPAAPVQRKVTVTPTPSLQTDVAGLKAMTLDEFFGDHIRKQLDWSAKLSDADAAPLRQLIARVNGMSAIANACGPYKVGDLLALDAAGWTALEKYSQGVSSPKSPPTARLERETTLAAGRALGEATIKLEAAVGGACLYHIAHHDAIKQLMLFNFVDSFVAYVAAVKPVLHANRSEEAAGNDELRSYFRTKMLIDPLALQGSLPRVRNLHRFDGMGLMFLAAAAKDVSKKKPVTLILHSALDHNAAFHHDPNMTAVMLDSRFLPIMIEGATSLAEVTGQVDDIAKTYGPGNKIAQVMIAGHGGPRGMEMAGTVSENIPADKNEAPSMNQKADSIDIDHTTAGNNSAETDKLFDALLRNLDGSASGRMVFNACLTGSTEVEVDPLSPDSPEKQIADTIKNKPNLTDYLRQRAKDQGVTADVRGANGSFGQVGLTDGAGKLDIVNPNDPALTSSKLEYIEMGTEAEGVMRAVLELWEDPAVAAKKADSWLVRLQNRLKAPKGAWNHVIIQTFFDLINTSYQGDPAAIQGFIPLAHPLNQLRDPNHAHVSEVTGLLTHPDGLAILTSLGKASGFAKFPKLVLLQIWLKLDAGKRADLITELAGWNVSKAENHVDTSHLGDADLLAMLTPTVTPTPGQLVLACIDRLSNPHAASEAFLLKVVGTADEFPAALGVPALLGTRSADDVLATIGRGPFADKGGGATAKKGPRTEAGNLDLDADTSNESFAEPVQKHGKVANCYVLRVRKRPSMAAETLEFLNAGDEVFVTGTMPGWHVIDFKGKPAFVGAAFIEL